MTRRKAPPRAAKPTPTPAPAPAPAPAPRKRAAKPRPPKRATSQAKRADLAVREASEAADVPEGETTNNRGGGGLLGAAGPSGNKRKADRLLGDGTHNRGGGRLTVRVRYDDPEGERTHNRGGGGLLVRKEREEDDDERDDDPEGEGTHGRGGGRLLVRKARKEDDDEGDDDPDGEGTHNRGGGGLFGMGYIRDLPDLRDHSLKDLLRHGRSKLRWMPKVLRNQHKLDVSGLPPEVDLRTTRGRGDAFGPVSSQGRTQSCTAHAVAAMSEYHLGLQRRQPPALSRLFLYKISRELLELETDSGCTLRETCKAMNKYGCVEKEEWPRGRLGLETLPRLRDLDRAANHQSLGYGRLDKSNLDGEQTLSAVLHCLADRHPVAFGFSLHSCHLKSTNGAVIPFPASSSGVLGGHAVLAVGYRLDKASFSHAPQGELLVRNSWGREWGENGYGWLPFEYVTQQLATDFWFQYALKPA